MELGPIFRALMHNKTRFWLITLEVALTLAIAVNCVHLMTDLRGDFNRDTGLDEDNIIVVQTQPFSDDYEEEEFVDALRERDLVALEAHSGVRAATAITAVPLSGGGSSTSRKALGSEMDGIGSPYFVVTENALEALGVEVAAGRGFVPEDFLYEEDEDGNAINRNVLLTRRLAETIFPEGDAVGKMIQNEEGEITNTVIGLIERMHNSWPSSDTERTERVMLLPGKPGGARRMRYMVRTEPGALETVFGELEAVVIANEPNRIVKLETLTEVKNDTYSATRGLTKILGAVIVLLVLVTSLGIIGLTAFSVTERTRQIGTRRALGASKTAIARYFLIENWIVSGIGMIFGVALAYGLNFALGHVADSPKLDWQLLAGAVGLMWCLCVAAALAPALRAATVPPELATRTV